MSKDVSKLILKHERYELDFPQERGWTSARSLCSSARRTRLRLLDPLSDRTSLLSPLIPSNTLNNTKRSDRSICAQGCNFNDTLTEPLPLDPPQVKKNKKQKHPGKSACITMLYFLFCFAGPMFLFLGFHAVLHHSVSTDKDCQRKWSSTQDTTKVSDYGIR